MRNIILKSLLRVFHGRCYRMTCFQRFHVYNYKFGCSFTSTCNKYYCTSSSDFSVNNPIIKKYIDKLTSEYKSLCELNEEKDSVTDVSSRLAELRPIIKICDSRHELFSNLTSLEEVNMGGDSTDKELQSLVKEESQMYKQKLKALDFELLQMLLPRDRQDACKSIILEVSAGVGGQEAMLFGRELCDMYTAYADFKGWHMEIAEMELSEIGGLRHASLFISGDDAFKHLKHEAGVHRVQRVPSTERSGRVHTSTVAVATLPQPEEVDVELKDKDLRIETKRASGAGGQHVNTTDSAVRVVHLPTGITVECQVDRSQIKNRQHALQRLRAKLYQQQLDEQLAETNATRKLQVKSNLRSEKIRTYNFNQDRITDHRLSGNLHNMRSFLSGGELLESLIQQLEIHSSKERLFQIISETMNS